MKAQPRSSPLSAVRIAAGRLGYLALLLTLLGMLPVSALALTPIDVSPDADRIEITTLGETYEGRGDSLQVEAAGDTSGRMSVRAATSGTNPNWIVFALSNNTDKPIERWLTAERYNVIGSGAVWPDLDARRIEAVTPSVGFVPERIKNDRADIFRITLEPGQTITYVAELSSERFARIYLWKPIAYELKVRDRQLFNGIMLGLTGLLAIFLTAIFAANHKAIFPTAALAAWCVLAYLCVDFGFFHKLFQLRPEDNAVYRASTEAAMAASILIFLYTFLRLAQGHALVRMIVGVWVLAELALVAVAVIDPRLASTFARVSFLAIGGVGAMFTFFLAMRGQDRALSLVPTWLLFLVWIFGAGVTLTGRLSGDVVVSGLVAGLVLIVLLIGFTVTQFAFRSLEPLYGSAPTELQLRSLALEGAGASVWEWNGRRDEMKVDPLMEIALGLSPGELSTKVDGFIKHLHQSDQERFRLMLWSIQERSGGKIRVDFRMRHADNSYRWFELEAANVPGNDRRALRCVGLMRDVTDAKRAHERLLYDAVHDSLTGLPNRELFLDRLGVAVLRSKTEPQVRSTVLFVDIDKFKSVNTSFGLVVGDSLLLTTARRLQRHLGPQDTLARVGGDQFAILLLSQQDPRELAGLAERIRRSLRSPIKIAGQDIVLTGSLGIAVYDGEEASHHDLLKEAEIAMYRAKRGGADRIEIFRPEMRAERDDRVAIESDLRKALEKQQLKVLYQPIIYLPTEELAGFEALVRWEHPRLGQMNPEAFIPLAEGSDLIVKLGSFVLLRAVQDAARWHKELPRPDAPLFVSVNVSSRQLFRQDLIQEIRHILGRSIIPKGALRLEVTESLVMENPEQATEMLELLRGAGADLALDDFGTGYSSLAYLQHFPFDTIKIDRSLVQSSSRGDSAGSVIVRSMVAMSHELGKKVVAEGVETADDVGFLRSIDCEYAQGFYYGEPMPEKDVLHLLKVVRKTEPKLRPRGFFRTKTKKKKEEGTKTGAAGAPLTTPASHIPDSAVAPPANLDHGAATPRKGTVRTRNRATLAAASTAPAPPTIIGPSQQPAPRTGSPVASAPNVPPPPRPSSRGRRPAAQPASSAVPAAPPLPPAAPPPLPASGRPPQASPPPVPLAPPLPAEALAALAPHGWPAPPPAPSTPSSPPEPGFGPLGPLPPLPFTAAAQGVAPAAGENSRQAAPPEPAKPPPLPELWTGTAPQSEPQFSALPPGIAASLAKLAGMPPTPGGATTGGAPARSQTTTGGPAATRAPRPQNSSERS